LLGPILFPFTENSFDLAYLLEKWKIISFAKQYIREIMYCKIYREKEVETELKDCELEFVASPHHFDVVFAHVYLLFIVISSLHFHKVAMWV
jgi:hypothetical protein